MDTVERDPAVLSLDITGWPGQFDLDLTADAEWLLILCELVVFRRVWVEIILTIPLTDFGNLAAKHQAELSALFDRGVIQHWQCPRQA